MNMREIRHRLEVRIASGLLLIAAALGALVYGFVGRSSLCGTHVHRRVPSPDASLEAVVFDMDCGAATGFNTQVAILRKPAAASVSTESAVFVINGIHQIDIRWTDLRTLAVPVPRIPGGDRIFKQDQAKAGVQVRYE